MKLFVHPWIFSFFTHFLEFNTHFLEFNTYFLEFNTHKMPHFLCY